MGSSSDFNAFDAFRRLYSKLEALKGEMAAYEAAAQSVHTPTLSRAINGILLPLISLLVAGSGIFTLIFAIILATKDYSGLGLHPQELEQAHTLVLVIGMLISLILFLVSFLMWKLYASYRRIRKGQAAIHTARTKTTDRIHELERLIKQLLDNRGFFNRSGPEPPADN